MSRIVALPGDGIGEEVMDAAIRVLGAVYPEATVEQHPIGLAAIEQTGSPLPDSTLQAAAGADAVLLGAVGGVYDSSLAAADQPETALFRLRQALDTYANIRLARADGVDVLLVRELVAGIYYGSRGTRPNGDVFDTCEYSPQAVRRVVRRAFELAASRGGRLTLVDKANVLETSRLWRRVVDETRTDYGGVSVDYLLADTAALRLAVDPGSFDVIVTDNMFGDILSELLAIPQGGMGTLTSASLGDSAPGIFEPVHGSAPDIAGRGIANPAAMIGSVGLMFELGFEAPAVATRIRLAVEAAEARVPTPDLGGNATTHAFVDAVVEELTAEPFSGVSAAT